MGVGVGAKYKKKYTRKGKLNEKNSCTPINPKKYSCHGLKKINPRNLLNHNFSNGPSLTCFICGPWGVLFACLLSFNWLVFINDLHKCFDHTMNARSYIT